jgi:hypothetical protein
MITLTRRDVLTILQGDWGTYVQRFRRLSPEAQSTFLVKQGYARFTGWYPLFRVRYNSLFDGLNFI